MLSEKDTDEPMFIYKTLAQLVPKDHLLRKIKKVIDLTFVRDSVRELYCKNKGRPSIDPVVAVKIWLIGYLYGISSERRLMADIQVNLAYRWFIGYNLEEEIPDHSSLTRIRDRFGLEKFQGIFDEVIRQCREKGLITGDHLNVDATLVRADASIDSMRPIEEFTRDVFEKNPLKEKKSDEPKKKPYKPGRRISNKTHRSTSDPDATLMKKHDQTGTHLSYHCHMAVESESRFITGVLTTTGTVTEGLCLTEIIREQKEKYGFKVEDVAADKGYSSTENYADLDQMGVKAYIPVGRKYDPARRRGYGPEKFKYDPEKHELTCLRGKKLHALPTQRRKYSIDFISSTRDCKACRLRKKCGITKLGHKKIQINILKHLKDEADKRCWTEYGRKRSVDRKTTVETVFGQGKTQHLLGRARVRGIEKVGIQFLMSAIAMNIKRMVKCLHTSLSRLFGLMNPVVVVFWRFIRLASAKVSCRPVF